MNENTALPLRREALREGAGHSAAMAHKREWILTRECQFAHRTALRLVDKPELSVWMILIPIIFLHYIYRAQKFKAGLQAVTRELLKNRELAFDLAQEAAAGATTARDPGERFPAGSDTSMGRDLREAEIHLARVLVEHYERLLRAPGTSYTELVRAAYGSRARYREFLVSLTAAEARVAACAAQSADEVEAAMLARIASSRREQWDEDARLCFA